MKTTLIALAAASLFSGAVLAAGGAGSGKAPGDGMGMGGQGPGDGMGMGGKGSGGMGAGQSMEQMRATQQDRFRSMDGNQDGIISREEAQNHRRLSNNWKEADKNSDGTVDAAEFSAFETKMPPGTGR